MKFVPLDKIKEGHEYLYIGLKYRADALDIMIAKISHTTTLQYTYIGYPEIMFDLELTSLDGFLKVDCSNYYRSGYGQAWGLRNII